MLSWLRARVQSLVRELKSHKKLGQINKDKMRSLANVKPYVMFLLDSAALEHFAWQKYLQKGGLRRHHSPQENARLPRDRLGV